MEHKGFEVPNHTQTPNSFFDVSLPEIKSLVELKVVLAVIRQTFGWQKTADRISLSQLQRLTGLSRESVSTGIQSALEHGHVERKAVKNGFLYNLKLVRNSDQSGIPTSQTIRPKVVRDSDQKVVGIPDTQKKGIKEKKEIHPAYGRLFDKHAKRIGHVSDGGAQGSALKWLLGRYTEDQLIECYRSQLREVWRKGRVSWLTVRKDIALWATANNAGNGRAVAATMADIQQMKEAR